MLIVLFLVTHFNFLFVPCGGLSWLPVSFLMHVKYTLSYRIVLDRRCRLGGLEGKAGRACEEFEDNEYDILG